jgi:hypothetical protein
MWICQCWLTQLTWLELIINYDTHDYNVIFNDMVLIKWGKSHVLILKTSLQKKWQNIWLSWFQLLFIIIQIKK